MDVGGEIYILRNSGSVSVAKEYVPAQLLSFAAIERDAQRSILNHHRIFRKPIPDAPHLNPLPASGARRSGTPHLTPMIHFPRRSACILPPKYSLRQLGFTRYPFQKTGMLARLHQINSDLGNVVLAQLGSHFMLQARWVHPIWKVEQKYHSSFVLVK